MNLRDCEGLYRCGKGTDELCRKALCPFYKPQANKKTEETEPQPKKKVSFHVKGGRWERDDFSGIWVYVED